MNIDLTEEETVALLREIDGIITNNRYFLSPRVQTLKAIRVKLRPEPVPEPLPPRKRYEPPRATARRRRRSRRPAGRPRSAAQLRPAFA